MKVLTFLSLLLMSSLACCQQVNFNELGRSLANYQACSQVAMSIHDHSMHGYYQKMFNDTTFSALSVNPEGLKMIYSAWEESEKVLLNIEVQSLQKICLRRFDGLLRNMLNKIATQ